MSSNHMPLRSVRLQNETSLVANRHVNVGNVGSFKNPDDSMSRNRRRNQPILMGIIASDEQLRSPNFHPNFTRAVAAVRNDVEIAVLRSAGGQPVGLMPFQRVSEQTAAPIGGRMNDYHGLLLSPGVKFDLETLLHRLDIRRLLFHSVSANQEYLDNYKFDVLPSFSIDLGDGYDRYMNWAIRCSQTLRRLPQKERALARDHGPVRFEFDCNQQEVLEHLIELKSKKYIKTNTFDILSVGWAADLLREIHRYQDADFRGVLSVLRAGDSIAAVHFGMIAGKVMQYWFPVYDSAFSKYSPGLQLMTNTIRSCCEVGIETIDLSYGQSKFKELFANEQEDVLFGEVQFNPLAFQIAKQRYAVRKMLKDMPLKEPAKSVLRKVFPNYGRWHFK